MEITAIPVVRLCAVGLQSAGLCPVGFAVDSGGAGSDTTITDALLWEDGTPMLWENEDYVKLEN